MVEPLRKVASPFYPPRSKERGLHHHDETLVQNVPHLSLSVAIIGSFFIFDLWWSDCWVSRNSSAPPFFEGSDITTSPFTLSYFYFL